jgi:hypothetical protein
MRELHKKKKKILEKRLTKQKTSCKINFAVTNSTRRVAQLAQLVEQGTENPRVSGSIPELGICGCSSMVEHQPSKLDTRVRFPLPALCDSSTVGSTPPCQGGGREFESRLSLSISQVKKYSPGFLLYDFM